MLYFFHHYELPVILQQAQLQHLLFRNHAQAGMAEQPSPEQPSPISNRALTSTEPTPEPSPARESAGTENQPQPTPSAAPGSDPANPPNVSEERVAAATPSSANEEQSNEGNWKEIEIVPIISIYRVFVSLSLLLNCLRLCEIRVGWRFLASFLPNFVIRFFEQLKWMGTELFLELINYVSRN